MIFLCPLVSSVRSVFSPLLNCYTLIGVQPILLARSLKGLASKGVTALVGISMSDFCFFRWVVNQLLTVLPFQSNQLVELRKRNLTLTFFR